jgi:hypothetical protein
MMPLGTILLVDILLKIYRLNKNIEYPSKCDFMKPNSFMKIIEYVYH